VIVISAVADPALLAARSSSGRSGSRPASQPSATPIAFEIITIPAQPGGTRRRALPGRRARARRARARPHGDAVDGDLSLALHPRHAGRSLDRLLGLARLRAHADPQVSGSSSRSTWYARVHRPGVTGCRQRVGQAIALVGSQRSSGFSCGRSRSARGRGGGRARAEEVVAAGLRARAARPRRDLRWRRSAGGRRRQLWASWCIPCATRRRSSSRRTSATATGASSCSRSRRQRLPAGRPALHEALRRHVSVVYDGEGIHRQEVGRRGSPGPSRRPLREARR
jgi:hypothetical protein